MRKWIASVVLVAFCFVTFTGCAGTQNKAADPNYALYVEAMRLQAAQKQEPLMKMELWDDGSVKSLSVAVPKDPIRVEQRKSTPHPGWAVLNGLIRVGGIVGGIWATGNALEGLVSAGNAANVTNIGSGNTAGGDLTASTTLANSYNNVSGTSSFNGTGVWDSMSGNAESPTSVGGSAATSAADSHDTTTTSTNTTDNSTQ
jgi:hypothetical protein